MNVITKTNNGEISFNFEELKEQAENYIALYDGAVVDDDNYSLAKKELASLRKIQKRLDEESKNVKNEYLKPYNEFEAKVKELEKLFNTPIETLDSQIKALDNRDKENKKDEIKRLYDRLIMLEEYMPFDEIFNQKWLNKTFSMTDITNEMLDKQSIIQSDIKVIKANCSDGALEYYKKTKHLESTLEMFKSKESLPFEFKKYEVYIDVANEKVFIEMMAQIGADYKEI